MDIRAVFEDYRESGEEIQICCPFCNDTKYHMYVSTAKPVAHCFRCNWGGNHLKLLVESGTAESYPEAQRLLRRPPTDVSSFADINSLNRVNKRTVVPPEAYTGMPGWYRPFVRVDGIVTVGQYSMVARKVLAYALKRLSPLEIKRHGVGYSTHPDYAMQLILPVENGYWQGRAIVDNGGRKYVNPDIPIGGRMFNSGALSRYKTVLIAEGIFSAIALGDNAVAVLGKEVNRQQFGRLVDNNVHVYIVAFDADTYGSEQVCRLCHALKAAGKEVLVRNYNVGDPDSSDDYEDVEFGLEYEVVCSLV